MASQQLMLLLLHVRKAKSYSWWPRGLRDDDLSGALRGLCFRVVVFVMTEKYCSDYDQPDTDGPVHKTAR